MKGHTYRVGCAVGEFVLLSILAILPAASAYIDVVVIGGRVGELSVTEITQVVLLAITVLSLLYGAWQHPSDRGFLMLVAGFFNCALIRELDFLFDKIWHGFWFWPALAVALSTIAYVVVCCKNSVAGPMSNFFATRYSCYILTGLIMLLVFSRTFGSGALLWKHMLEDAYTGMFKSALQEGLELFGYLFITYGSLLFFARRFDSRVGHQERDPVRKK